MVKFTYLPLPFLVDIPGDRMKFPLILLVIHFISGERAISAPSTVEKRSYASPVAQETALYLLELGRRPTKVTGTLLANRVYSRFAPSLGKWVLVLTDKDRRLSHPMEILVSDSVLPGTMLGAKTAFQNYKLTDSGKWIPTNDSIQIKLFVSGNPPVLKFKDTVAKVE